MTKKFTEEQYQKIVSIGQSYHDDRVTLITKVMDYMYDYFGFKGVDTEPLDQAISIANPLTREWAYDKFVEKESEFHFILKDTRDLQDRRYHLVRNGRGAIILYPFGGDDKPVFKESEIKKWGFNLKAFEREEV